MSKILIIEDEAAIRRVLNKIICNEDDKYVVEEAEDGLVAVAEFEQLKPDAILLDVMMPKMSGFEVCRRIKNDPKTADIPVIMVTALNEMGDIERAINSGTDDFLSKPVNKWSRTSWKERLPI